MTPILLPHPRSLQLTGGSLAGGATASIRETIHGEGRINHQYTLHIRQDGIEISATSAAMAFHARQTLAQLRRQFPDALPCLRIEDWPDFPVRGVMLDISRDKVPKMATLLALVDQLAELKVNQLQLYTEHTFAYRGHEAAWKDSSPMTADEVRQLDTYCRERFIELVPNQNSFGHLERWLKHPEYRHLAECPDGFTWPWGYRMPTGFSLNPLDPRSLELVEGLFDELLPNFTSELLNVGCDETFDLGLGRSKAEVERRGRERVYLEFLLKIYDAVKRRGSTMMFWGDIILHKPELLKELPRDVVALNWGYEANHPFEKETRAIQDAGVPFYVCPGTSSWCSFGGRTANALANLASAAENGLKHGAGGYLITDWGDHGHLQYLPTSYIPLAAGAAYSWSLESNRTAAIHEAIDLHIFRDGANVMSRLMYDLGTIHEGLGQKISNASPLFWVMIDHVQRKKLYEGVTIEEYATMQRRIDEILAPLGRAQMRRADAALIAEEVRNTARMIRHACRRGSFLIDRQGQDLKALGEDLRSITEEHRRLWLARNRQGGLSDSARRLELLQADYQTV